MSEPRELLSAYLDAELTPEEAALVDSRLEADAELRSELAELAATRAMLRALPEVEPRRPLGIEPAPQRARGRLAWRRAAVAVGAAAAVWLVVLTVGVRLGSLPVVPEVDQLALQHASAASTMGFAEMSPEQMADDPAVLDDIGHGMVRDAIYQSGEVVQVRYSDGEHDVSVFHQWGRVDWDALPDSGEMTMMEHGPAWMSDMGEVNVLVTERGDLVVTIVADGDMGDEMTMAASKMVPPVDDDEDGIIDRIMDAPSNVFDRF